MISFKRTLLVCSLLLGLFACAQDKPAGPDLAGIDTLDQAYFTETYNRCNINNSTNDCNCIARINVEHRAAAFAAYSASYETTHKPALEQEIETLSATLAEKTANRSDPRILAAMEDDLHRLKQKLAAGLESIENFTLSALHPNATSGCKLGG